MSRLHELIGALDDRAVDDLLDEIADKNRVRVSVWRATSGPVGIRHKRVDDEVYPTVANLPSIVREDENRVLFGRKPVYLQEAIRRLGGELVSVTPNLRTNMGVDFVCQQLSNAGSTYTISGTTFADYIALSNNTITPGATDAVTTVPWNTVQATDPAPSGTTGEYTALGLTRAAATAAHTSGGPAAGNNTYTLSKTFTASSAITSVRLAGLFGGPNKTTQGGTNAQNILFLESSFTSTTLATNDQLSLVWTVTV